MASNVKRLSDLLSVWTGGLVIATGAALYSGNEQYYSQTVMPLAHRLLEPETAHRLAVKAAAWGLVPRASTWAAKPRPELQVAAFGRRFPHPIGLAAGFDKDAEAVDTLQGLGFSFVEVGSVTPLPQPGNPTPRLFRLPEDRAVINRYGFNSSGCMAVADNLRRQAHGSIVSGRRRQVDDGSSGIDKSWVGVNLGVNKTSSNPIADYAIGAEVFSELADYLVVNVSSPNTPGLRKLQAGGSVGDILDAVRAAAVAAVEKGRSRQVPKILLKISPDCTDSELSDICSAALSHGADGLVVSNTTVTRPPSLTSPASSEVGGLSGRPLAPLANAAIGRVYAITGGRLPIIGVGGVDSGADALEKLESGASLLQVYTVLVYEGPQAVGRICRELGQLLEQKGYATAQDAVGAKHRGQGGGPNAG